MTIRRVIWLVVFSGLILSGLPVCGQEVEPAVVDTASATAEPAEDVGEPEEAEETAEEMLTWADSLVIKEAVMCEEVENREPEYIGTTFGKDIELVYCHTVVERAQDSTSIRHVWYFGDEEMASVPLKVGKSARWRTWSSKIILPRWTGDWRVDIVSEHGRILRSVRFKTE